MKNRNILIIGLLLIGAVLLGIIQLVIVPHDVEEKKKYALAQMEATTHDINSILKYKNKYMGNSSNTINLFYHLPLATTGMKFHLLSDKLTVQVNFEDNLLQAGKESMSQKAYAAEGLASKLNEIYINEVDKSLIYNSTAVFALIDNLEGIIYNFKDKAYIVKREDIKKLYVDFNTILEEDKWEKEVQSRLADNEYVSESFKACFTEQPAAEQ